MSLDILLCVSQACRAMVRGDGLAWGYIFAATTRVLVRDVKILSELGKRVGN